MLSLALIERRIKEIVKAEHSNENVQEFALMCLARDYLLAEISEQENAKPAAQRPRVILTDYCADLNRVPNPQEIEKAIAAAASAAYTPEARQQLRDMNTWADILANAEKS